jgi:murein tripeptide amidase MpaA
MALLARIAGSPRARVEVLGQTLDGRDLELVTIGTPGSGKRVCWIVARHHPGETQGEFAAERIMERLVDEADPVARRLLDKAVFHIVPNMNPDGSWRGHHRVNAALVDLNRAWSDTTPEKSPEVFLVRERMRATGVDFCLDLHADEREHWVWPVGTTGIPGFNDRLKGLRSAFDRALVGASPDYRPDKPDRKIDMAPGKDPLSMCTSWVAQTFNCLALIVELPFLDNTGAPDPRTGWSPRRSALFGAASLDALAAVIDELR